MIRRPPISTRTCTRFPSTAHFRSILARVGAAGEGAGLPVDLDGLAAADRLGRRLNAVAALLVAGEHFGRHAALDFHLGLVRRRKEAGEVDRLLHVEAEVDENRKSTSLNSSH